MLIKLYPNLQNEYILNLSFNNFSSIEDDTFYQINFR